MRICHVPEKSRVRGFSTKPARGPEESERNARSPRSGRLFDGQVLNELRSIFREELAAVDADKVVTRYRLEESKPRDSKFSGRSPMPKRRSDCTHPVPEFGICETTRQVPLARPRRIWLLLQAAAVKSEVVNINDEEKETSQRTMWAVAKARIAFSPSLAARTSRLRIAPPVGAAFEASRAC